MDRKNEDIERLERTIDILVRRRKQLLIKMNSNLGENRSLYTDELNTLAHKLSTLEEELLLAEGPSFCNQEIDLYLSKADSSDEVEMYFITTHGTLNKIGQVRITLKNANYFLGNIGYRLDKDYRGNGYALQALELLKDNMIEKGVTSPIITVYPSNIASVKTIEKFGGKLLFEAANEEAWDIYEVDLLKNDDSKKR